MKVGLGMRGKDLRVFGMVAQKYGVIILVRHTNPDSLAYVGRDGFYPKPAAIKAKTADFDPAPQTQLIAGRKTAVQYDISGLVVHPGFQPKAYNAPKVPKAMDCWNQTMEVLAPSLAGKPVDPTNAESRAVWGVERRGVNATRWSWRVDIDPASKRFGCLQIKSGEIPWSYVHGDYDLKDVIVEGHEADNRRNEGKLDGVKNFTPLLRGMEFETIQREINQRIGVEMVQHGAEAQFAWHGDEPITVIYPHKPDIRFEIFGNAETVQSWYMEHNRDVLAKMGKDYMNDRSRWFWFGDHGNLFKPGGLPGLSWG